MSERFERLKKRLKGIGDKGVALGEKALQGDQGRMPNAFLYPGASGAAAVTMVDKDVQRYRDATRVRPDKQMRSGATRAAVRKSQQERFGMDDEQYQEMRVVSDEKHAANEDRLAKEKARKAAVRAYGGRK